MYERTDEREHQPEESCSGYHGIDAHYIDQILPLYRGNPLIEALSPIYTSEEAHRLLRYVSNYNEQDRQLSAELRIQLILNGMRFLQPLSNHIRLEQLFSGMLRSGYVARNPFATGTFHIKNQQPLQLERGLMTSSSSQLMAQGCTLVGLSGTGKKTAINAILSLYDQIINHSFFHDQPLSLCQLTWMKLECPYDGLLSGLCKNFFKEVDRLMKTHTYQHYVNNHRQSIDEMLTAMANVAAIHCLGVLVIDNVQNLREAKKDNTTRILNFLGCLRDRLGIPVVLVGSPKVLPTFSQELFQARHASGQGVFLWDRMQEDKEWNTFTEALWRYQYLRRPTPLSDELCHVLYDESQGIADLAIKVYKQAQIEAINRATTEKEEVITKNLLHSVAQNCLRLVQPFLHDLRVGLTETDFSWKDIAPIDFNKPQNMRNETPDLSFTNEEEPNE